MLNRFTCIIKACSILISLVFCSAVIANQNSANSNPLIKKIHKLEKDYRKLSSAFYQNYSRKSTKELQPITDIAQLLIRVNKLKDSNQSVKAIQLIYFNRKTIEDNLDTKALFKIIELLLEKNEWNLANTLYQQLKSEGDKSLLAPVQFIFAKYHAKRDEWKQVVKLLDGVFTDLSEENVAYAYLLHGSALQHIKKHRQAVNSYSKVPATSKYYSYAQLNTAIANIRQGWWTDAQTKIKHVLKVSNKTNKDELTNRLYLILGYALLQREYYRDARDAFRHIGLESRYTNRALLGIGLTATSQGDYIGGLNALTILKDKKTFDLSVDESYLLVPYVYEKLQQEMTVSTSYTDAMNYFTKRMHKLDKMSAKHIDFKYLDYDQKTMSLNIQNNSFNYGNKYPESFLNNFNQLYEFQKISKNSKFKKRISKLLSKYDATYQDVISDLADQRQGYLKSYLNQSRYGLARLYDSSNEKSN